MGLHSYGHWDTWQIDDLIFEDLNALVEFVIRVSDICDSFMGVLRILEPKMYRNTKIKQFKSLRTFQLLLSLTLYTNLILA